MSLEVHGPDGSVLVSFPMAKLGPRRFRYVLEGTPPGLARKICGFVVPADAEGPCAQPMIESLKRDGGEEDLCAGMPGTAFAYVEPMLGFARVVEVRVDKDVHAIHIVYGRGPGVRVGGYGGGCGG